MDTRHVDALGKLLSFSDSRRRLGALLVTLPVAAGIRDLVVPQAAQGKRHMHKKKKPAPTPTCTPNPKTQTCSGKCGTVTNNCQQVVDCGTCCDVRCADTPTACGAALQAAIDVAVEGATLVICPGTYRGGFTINKALTLIGAGDGDRPSRNTILDGNKAQRVLEIPGGTGSVTLQGLQITRGNVGDDFGGGILHEGTRLVIQDSTIAGNRGRSGGGIVHGSGMLELTRCTVRNNVAPNIGLSSPEGGGLLLGAQSTLTDCLVANNESEGPGGGLRILARSVILAGTTVIRDNVATQGGGIAIPFGAITVGADCLITGNTADAGQGGGIYQFNSTVTLDGPDPSPIVVDNCHENCVGNVPKCAIGNTCPA